MKVNRLRLSVPNLNQIFGRKHIVIILNAVQKPSLDPLNIVSCCMLFLQIHICSNAVWPMLIL